MGSRGRLPPEIERGPCRGLAEVNIGGLSLRRLCDASRSRSGQIRPQCRAAASPRAPRYELLTEMGRDHLIRTAIETKGAYYTDRLTLELLAAADGNRFPPAPLWPVGG